MNFFRRRGADSNATTGGELPGTAASTTARVAEFWQRWYELLPEVTSALADGQQQRVEPLVADLVARLHPKLIFSFERGEQAQYALVVSGEADPELRSLTDAWKCAAPAPDQAWEYHDAVPAVPDPAEVTVNIGDAAFAVAEVRVVAQPDEAAGVVDVALYHPRFADFGEQQRTGLALLVLDATLGERLAADRLGRIETAEIEPTSTVELTRLRELVRELDQRRSVSP